MHERKSPSSARRNVSIMSGGQRMSARVERGHKFALSYMRETCNRPAMLSIGQPISRAPYFNQTPDSPGDVVRTLGPFAP